MTEVIDSTSTSATVGMEPAPGQALARKLSTEDLADELMQRAQCDGVSLVGPGGLLADLTKQVLEAMLEGEMTDHVGYAPHDPAGHHSGNSRNGTRAKTVLTEIGPVEIDVPRDRAGTFEPMVVPKRRRRLGGVDQMVLSLSAKGLTPAEIGAHLEAVYEAQVSKETTTRITDSVTRDDGGVAEPAPRGGVPGGVRRRDLREDPGGAGREPADLRGGRGHRGRRTRHSRAVGGRGRRGRQVLASRPHRDPQPGHRGCVHSGLRRPERAPRRCGGGVAPGDCPDLHRAPIAQQLPV